MSNRLMFVSYRKACRTERHVSHDDMSYSRHVFSLGEHVLQENISCSRTCRTGRYALLGSCLTGGHVLRYGMSYWVTSLTGEHVLR